MTLTEKDLQEWEKAAHIWFTSRQRRDILERFGTEPAPYEWTEQDITVQIQNLLECGEFVKTIRGSRNRQEAYSGKDADPIHR